MRTLLADDLMIVKKQATTNRTVNRLKIREDEIVDIYSVCAPV